MANLYAALANKWHNRAPCGRFLIEQWSHWGRAVSEHWGTMGVAGACYLSIVWQKLQVAIKIKRICHKISWQIAAQLTFLAKWNDIEKARQLWAKGNGIKIEKENQPPTRGTRNDYCRNRLTYFVLHFCCCRSGPETYFVRPNQNSKIYIYIYIYLYKKRERQRGRRGFSAGKCNDGGVHVAASLHLPQSATATTTIDRQTFRL